MSDQPDNIVPLRPVGNERDSAPVTGNLAPGGGGPHDPSMDARVTALETAVARMEPLLVRIDERTGQLATKADLAITTGSIAAQTATVQGIERRLTQVEGTLQETVKAALSKTLGVGGAVGLFASLAAIIGVAFSALRYFHMI